LRTSWKSRISGSYASLASAEALAMRSFDSRSRVRRASADWRIVGLSISAIFWSHFSK
jgi:hypothetical protein